MGVLAGLDGSVSSALSCYYDLMCLVCLYYVLIQHALSLVMFLVYAKVNSLTN